MQFFFLVQHLMQKPNNDFAISLNCLPANFESAGRGSTPRPRGNNTYVLLPFFGFSVSQCLEWWSLSLQVGIVQYKIVEKVLDRLMRYMFCLCFLKLTCSHRVFGLSYEPFSLFLLTLSSFSYQVQIILYPFFFVILFFLFPCLVS